MAGSNSTLSPRGGRAPERGGFVDRLIPFNLGAAQPARNVTSSEEATALKAEAEAQESLLARLKRLQPTGRIVLELPDDPVLADLPELPLEDGDRILIPQRPAMVTVFGTVATSESPAGRFDRRA